MGIAALRAFIFTCLLFVSAAAQQPDPLPEFSLPTFKGQPVLSEELKHSIVVLDFWATWCEGCITEIPAFNRLEQKYGPRGVKVIGIAVQSGWAKDIQKFAKRYKMRYTLLVGNDDTVSEFGVISFPAIYVIAPGWKLYKKYLGVSGYQSCGYSTRRREVTCGKALNGRKSMMKIVRLWRLIATGTFLLLVCAEQASAQQRSKKPSRLSVEEQKVVKYLLPIGEKTTASPASILPWLHLR